MITRKKKTGPFSVKNKEKDRTISLTTHKHLESERAKETAALVVSVAEALRVETVNQQRELRSATDQAFELMMKRFDVIEDQNDKQLKVISDHIKDDKIVAQTVQNHAMYWRLALAPLGVLMTGLVAWLIHTLLP